MNKFRIVGLLLVLALLAGTLGAVSAQEDVTICFGFQDLETEFWVAGHKAITETLRNMGITVLEYNANEDPNRQLEQVRECIAQGVDGIIIIPQDGDSAVTIINEAQAADIPIAVFNRPPMIAHAASPSWPTTSAPPSRPSSTSPRSRCASGKSPASRSPR